MSGAVLKTKANYLKSVFWDVPDLTDWDLCREFLRRTITEDNTLQYRWFMTRFLEHARVTDAFALFSCEQIKNELPHLKLTSYAERKWNRLLEVYED